MASSSVVHLHKNILHELVDRAQQYDVWPLTALRLIKTCRSMFHRWPVQHRALLMKRIYFRWYVVQSVRHGIQRVITYTTTEPLFDSVIKLCTQCKYCGVTCRPGYHQCLHPRFAVLQTDGVGMSEIWIPSPMVCPLLRDKAPQTEKWCGTCIRSTKPWSIDDMWEHLVKVHPDWMRRKFPDWVAGAARAEIK